jgi:hypothetical protein
MPWIFSSKFIFWLVSVWPSAEFWERIEYFSEAFVIVGAIGELLTDFKIILKKEEQADLRDRIGKCAGIALIIGLALELGALVRTNEIFTGTISVLYGQTQDAITKAGDAKTNADLASSAASRAKLDAQDAQDFAEGAQKKADEAQGTAQSAKKYSVDANKLANGAEESAEQAKDDAGVAQQSAALLQSELEAAAESQLASDQFLLNEANGRQLNIDLADLLRKHAPAQASVEYLGSKYLPSDKEPELFARVILSALRSAGWKVPPRPVSQYGINHGTVVFNKSVSWVPAEAPIEIRPTGERDRDPTPVVMGLKSRGFDWPEAERLALLVIATGAVLEKDDKLSENSFRIVVGFRPSKKSE